MTHARCHWGRVRIDFRRDLTLATVPIPLCPDERGRFAGSSPVALSERSDFSDRPGGPSAAKAARRAGEAGRASLPTCLHEQESRSPAGARPGAASQQAPTRVGADDAVTGGKVPTISRRFRYSSNPHPLPGPPLEGEGGSRR